MCIDIQYLNDAGYLGAIQTVLAAVGLSLSAIAVFFTWSINNKAQSVEHFIFTPRLEYRLESCYFQTHNQYGVYNLVIFNSSTLPIEIIEIIISAETLIDDIKEPAIFSIAAGAENQAEVDLGELIGSEILISLICKTPVKTVKLSGKTTVQEYDFRNVTKVIMHLES